MYEVELKVEATHDEVRDRLDDAGGTFVESVVQEDVYYDAPDRNFAETDEALRIREETKDGETITKLTYKGPLIEAASKTREEAEMTVSDPAEMRLILDGLGYEPAATVRKERDRYTLANCTVTLDTVDGLGEFVEVERETADDVESTREAVIEVMEQLGLNPDEQIRTSYLGLLLADD